LTWQPPRRRRHPWRLAFVLLGLGAIGVWVLSGLRQSDNGNGLTPGTANGGTHGRRTGADRTRRQAHVHRQQAELRRHPTRRLADPQAREGPVLPARPERDEQRQPGLAGVHGQPEAGRHDRQRVRGGRLVLALLLGFAAVTSTVDPGKTVEGTLVFDTPEKTRFGTVIVHDSPLSDGTPITLR